MARINGDRWPGRTGRRRKLRGLSTARPRLLRAEANGSAGRAEEDSQQVRPSQARHLSCRCWVADLSSPNRRLLDRRSQHECAGPLTARPSPAVRRMQERRPRWLQQLSWHPCPPLWAPWPPYDRSTLQGRRLSPYESGRHASACTRWRTYAAPPRPHLILRNLPPRSGYQGYGSRRFPCARAAPEERSQPVRRKALKAYSSEFRMIAACPTSWLRGRATPPPRERSNDHPHAP
mmetsp:Transcript_8312/g.24978  ORF Transcript_8312/g.24978 Transcript_8312/m.24978 type:complete len:234 (+) Transcript_8312:288-989(+)